MVSISAFNCWRRSFASSSSIHVYHSNMWPNTPKHSHLKLFIPHGQRPCPQNALGRKSEAGHGDPDPPRGKSFGTSFIQLQPAATCCLSLTGFVTLQFNFMDASRVQGMHTQMLPEALGAGYFLTIFLKIRFYTHPAILHLSGVVHSIPPY